ncbi:unnamed protein product [Nezara viridula]|uniref:Microtubule-associated protein futsch n=1 Tax=Nezara viridula TaxID=85310 RepID=A0A9P0MW33_NEZVI|nr:unnamed protein product [Nezara viridula]
MSDERRGDGEAEGPPPPSPLTGGYLLVLLPQLHSSAHKDRLLHALTKGLITWDAQECHVDLDKELQNITAQAPEGEEAKNGERLIQFASENLVTEVLIHPQLNTLVQCMRNCLSSFTRHRHIIHAGYTSAGNGAWVLQDGTYSFSDFADMYSEHEVQRVLRAYEGTVSVDVHCSGEGDWWALKAKDPFSKVSRVRLNPPDKGTTTTAVRDFLNYLSQYLVPAGLTDLLEPSDVVGNIRFSHPTLYVFPGGQGDAALFGINGFNMLVDGGFSRKACFWDFTRHLDRLDSVLMTRINNGNLQGLASLLKRKKSEQVYPQIGHFFTNIPDRKQVLSPDGDKDRDPLLINLIEQGQEMLSGLRHLGLKPQACYREPSVEPINLYHKVGHGKLDMYVLSPAKDSREVREFLAKWAAVDSKIFCSYSRKGEFNFPLSSKTSICALLVWQPANPEDNITRLLFPGSTPQQKIFEGLDRLKNLEFMKHPICSAKSLSPTSSTIKLSIKSTPKPAIIEKVAEIEKKQSETVKAVKQVGEIKKSTPPPPKPKPKADRPKEKPKTDLDSKPETVKIDRKTTEAVQKVDKEVKKEKPRRTMQKPQEKKTQKPSEKKTDSVKSSPTTPKKTVENKLTEMAATRTEMKTRASKAKASPTSTPAKSAKEENNRKVVELKSRESTKLQKAPPTKREEPKKIEKSVGKKPTASPKGMKSLSPIKGAKQPVKQRLDVKKTSKTEKDIITDSSAVSTPSTVDAELTKAKEEAEKTKEISESKPEDASRKASEDIGKSISKEDDDEILIIEKVEISDEVTGKADVEKIALHLQKLDEEKKKIPKEQSASAMEEKETADTLSQEKTVGETIPSPETKQVAQEEVQDIIETATEIVTKRLDIQKTDSQEISGKDLGSTEKIVTPKEKDMKSVDVEQKIDESQPDERFSTTVESGATTTAPTLPEDERIPLDEIKEGIEEKHVKEETKEKEIIATPRPEQLTSLPQVPVIAGTVFDQRAQLLKDIVKTPDEVADLPVHEEVDVGIYEGAGKDELLSLPPSKKEKKDDTTEELKLFKDNLEKEDKSKDLKEDMVESVDVLSHTTTDLDMISSSPKSGKPLESDEKEEVQEDEKDIGLEKRTEKISGFAEIEKQEKEVKILEVDEQVLDKPEESREITEKETIESKEKEETKAPSIAKLELQEIARPSSIEEIETEKDEGVCLDETTPQYESKESIVTDGKVGEKDKESKEHIRLEEERTEKFLLEIESKDSEKKSEITEIDKKILSEKGEEKIAPGTVQEAQKEEPKKIDTELVIKKIGESIISEEQEVTKEATAKDVLKKAKEDQKIIIEDLKEKIEPEIGDTMEEEIDIADKETMFDIKTSELEKGQEQDIKKSSLESTKKAEPTSLEEQKKGDKELGESKQIHDTSVIKMEEKEEIHKKTLTPEEKTLASEIAESEKIIEMEHEELIKKEISDEAEHDEITIKETKTSEPTISETLLLNGKLSDELGKSVQISVTEKEIGEIIPTELKKTITGHEEIVSQEVMKKVDEHEPEDLQKIESESTILTKDEMEPSKDVEETEDIKETQLIDKDKIVAEIEAKEEVISTEVSGKIKSEIEERIKTEIQETVEDIDVKKVVAEEIATEVKEDAKLIAEVEKIETKAESTETIKKAKTDTLLDQKHLIETKLSEDLEKIRLEESVLMNGLIKEEMVLSDNVSDSLTSDNEIEHIAEDNIFKKSTGEELKSVTKELSVIGFEPDTGADLTKKPGSSSIIDKDIKAEIKAMDLTAETKLSDEMLKYYEKPTQDDVKDETKPVQLTIEDEIKPSVDKKEEEIKIIEEKKEVETKPTEEKKELEIKPSEEKMEAEIKHIEEKIESEIKPTAEKKEAEIKLSEEKKKDEIKQTEEKKEAQIKTSAELEETAKEQKEVEIKLSEEKREPELQPTEERKEVEIKPSEEKTEPEVKPTEEKKEAELQPFEEKKEADIKLIEVKKEAEVIPSEEKKEAEIKLTEEQKELEIELSEEKKESEIKHIEEKIKTEIKPTQQEKEAEITPSEGKVEAEIKSTEEKKEAEIKSTEEQKESEIKHIEEKIESEIKPPEEKKEAEIKPTEEQKDLEIKSSEEKKEADLQPFEVQKEAEIKETGELKEVETKLTEEKKEAQLQLFEVKKEAEIKPTEEKKEAGIKSTEQQKESEIKHIEEKIESEIKPTEEKKEAEIKPTEEQKELEMKPTEEKKESEIKSTAEQKESEIKYIEEKKEAEIKATEEKKEAEIKPTEEKKEAQIKTTAEQKETETKPTEEHDEVEIKLSEEKKEPAVKVTKEEDYNEIKSTEEKKEPEVKPTEEKKEPELQLTEEKKEVEIKPTDLKEETERKVTEEGKEAEIKTIEEMKEGEIKVTEQKKDAEMKPIEEKKEAEIKPTELKKEAEIKLTEEQKGDEIKTSIEEKEFEIKHIEEIKQPDFKLTEEKMEGEMKTSQEPKEAAIKATEEQKEVKPSEEKKEPEVKPTDKKEDVEIKPLEEIKEAEIKKTSETKPTEGQKEVEIKPIDEKKEIEIKPIEEKKEPEVKATEAMKEVEIKPTDINIKDETKSDGERKEDLIKPTEEKLEEFALPPKTEGADIKTTEEKIVDEKIKDVQTKLTEENKIMEVEEATLQVEETSKLLEIKQLEKTIEDKLVTAEEKQVHLTKDEGKEDTETKVTEEIKQTLKETEDKKGEETIPTKDEDKASTKPQILSEQEKEEVEIIPSDEKKVEEIKISESNKEDKVKQTEDKEFLKLDKKVITEKEKEDDIKQAELKSDKGKKATELKIAEEQYFASDLASEVKEVESKSVEETDELRIKYEDEEKETKIKLTEEKIDFDMKPAEQDKEAESKSEKEIKQVEIDKDATKEAEIKPEEKKEKADTKSKDTVEMKKDALQKEVEIQPLGDKKDIEPKLADDKKEIELKSVEEKKEIQIKSEEDEKDIEFKSTDKKKEIELRSAEEKTEIELRSAEENGDVQLKMAEEMKEAEIKTRTQEDEIKAPGEKKEIELKYAEREDDQSKKEEEKKEGIEKDTGIKEKEIKTEEKKEIQLKSTKDEKETELKSADEKKVIELKSSDEKQEIVLKSTEDQKEIELKPAEEKKEIELKSATEKKDIELKSAEEKELFKISAEKKELGIKTGIDLKGDEIKLVEEKKDAEVKPPQEKIDLGEDVEEIETKPVEDKKEVEITLDQENREAAVKSLEEKDAQFKIEVEKKETDIKPEISKDEKGSKPIGEIKESKVQSDEEKTEISSKLDVGKTETEVKLIDDVIQRDDLKSTVGKEDMSIITVEVQKKDEKMSSNEINISEVKKSESDVGKDEITLKLADDDKMVGQIKKETGIKTVGEQKESELKEDSYEKLMNDKKVEEMKLTDQMPETKIKPTQEKQEVKIKSDEEKEELAMKQHLIEQDIEEIKPAGEIQPTDEFKDRLEKKETQVSQEKIEVLSGQETKHTSVRPIDDDKVTELQSVIEKDLFGAGTVKDSEEIIDGTMILDKKESMSSIANLDSTYVLQKGEEMPIKKDELAEEMALHKIKEEKPIQSIYEIEKSDFLSEVKMVQDLKTIDQKGGGIEEILKLEKESYEEKKATATKSVEEKMEADATILKEKTVSLADSYISEIKSTELKEDKILHDLHHLGPIADEETREFSGLIVAGTSLDEGIVINGQKEIESKSIEKTYESKSVKAEGMETVSVKSQIDSETKLTTGLDTLIQQKQELKLVSNVEKEKIELEPLEKIKELDIKATKLADTKTTEDLESKIKDQSEPDLKSTTEKDKPKDQSDLEHKELSEQPECSKDVEAKLTDSKKEIEVKLSEESKTEIKSTQKEESIAKSTQEKEEHKAGLSEDKEGSEKKIEGEKKDIKEISIKDKETELLQKVMEIETEKSTKIVEDFEFLEESIDKLTVDKKKVLFEAEGLKETSTTVKTITDSESTEVLELKLDSEIKTTEKKSRISESMEQTKDVGLSKSIMIEKDKTSSEEEIGHSVLSKLSKENGYHYEDVLDELKESQKSEIAMKSESSIETKTEDKALSSKTTEEIFKDQGKKMSESTFEIQSVETIIHSKTSEDKLEVMSSESKETVLKTETDLTETDLTAQSGTISSTEKADITEGSSSSSRVTITEECKLDKIKSTDLPKAEKGALDSSIKEEKTEKIKDETVLTKLPDDIKESTSQKEFSTASSMKETETATSKEHLSMVDEKIKESIDTKVNGFTDSKVTSEYQVSTSTYKTEGRSETTSKECTDISGIISEQKEMVVQEIADLPSSVKVEKDTANADLKSKMKDEKLMDVADVTTDHVSQITTKEPSTEKRTEEVCSLKYTNVEKVKSEEHSTESSETSQLSTKLDETHLEETTTVSEKTTFTNGKVQMPKDETKSISEVETKYSESSGIGGITTITTITKTITTTTTAPEESKDTDISKNGTQKTEKQIVTTEIKYPIETDKPIDTTQKHVSSTSLMEETTEKSEQVCKVEKIVTEKHEIESVKDVSVIKAKLISDVTPAFNGSTVFGGESKTNISKTETILNGSFSGPKQTLQQSTAEVKSISSEIQDSIKAASSTLETKHLETIKTEKSKISLELEKSLETAHRDKSTASVKEISEASSSHVSTESKQDTLKDLSMIKDMTASFISTERWTNRRTDTPEGRATPSSEATWRESDDDLPPSPLSTTSHLHSPPPAMYSSMYVQDDDSDISFGKPDIDFETAAREHVQTRGETLPKDPIEKWGKPLGLPPPPSGKDYWSPFKEWGRPLHLPSPAPAPAENDTEDTSGSAKTTPKKVAKMNEENNRYASNIVIGKEANNKNRRSDSPVKRNMKDSKKAGMGHIYLDLSYVPHHGNSHYANVEFFKRVRARYYVFSGTEPSKEVFNALLEAKQQWEDKDLEVTIIPTYDTDTLGYWIAENEETLSKYKIDLSPSASRCTINLQDHDTSCSAYRLEF